MSVRALSLSTVLAATLAASTAWAAEPQSTSTTTAPRHRRAVRVYDPVYHDYHRWSKAEKEAYREYLNARHLTYVSYRRQRAAEQAAYWRWRHERLEREQHER